MWVEQIITNYFVGKFPTIPFTRACVLIRMNMVHPNQYAIIRLDLPCTGIRKRY